jgi:hypothetical protein
MEVFQFLECCQTGKPTPLLRSELVRLQQQEEQQEEQQQQQELLPQHPVQRQLAELLQQNGRQQQRQQQQRQQQQDSGLGQQKNAGKDMSWSEVTYDGMKDSVPGVPGGGN